MKLAPASSLPRRYGRFPRGPVETAVQAVYLLTVPSGRFKVGIAKSPERRRRLLQCGNPERISLLGSSQISERGVDSREMERRLHSVLAEYRVCGEWFEAPIESAMMAWKYVWMSLATPAVVQRWARMKGRQACV